MEPETRIGACCLPEEELRKLPYLLKWVMVKGAGPFRMAEAGEPIDFLLVDVEQDGTSHLRPSGVHEIAVASKASNLPDEREGLTYPLRVVDLQRCLQTAGNLPASGPSAAPESGRAPTGNPAPGQAAERVDQLVEPLLSPASGTHLYLQGGEGIEILVNPDRGYHSPLAPREFGKVRKAIGHCQWAPLSRSAAETPKTWRPLDQLAWLLAYYGARDGLLPRIPRDRAFSLEAWPDYQLIPMEAKSLKVLAYLKWNTADAATIAKETGIDMEHVLGSLNAGFLCGQVKAAEARPRNQQRTRGEPGAGILNRIRQRLSLGAGAA